MTPRQIFTAYLRTLDPADRSVFLRDLECYLRRTMVLVRRAS